MNLVELGTAFRAARLRSNRTQQEVADLTGVSRARISAFENGALPELGVVKVLALFEVVGLEILARPAGQGRTLDDLVEEQKSPASGSPDIAPVRKRIRKAVNARDKISGAAAWAPAAGNVRKGGPSK